VVRYAYFSCSCVLVYELLFVVVEYGDISNTGKVFIDVVGSIFSSDSYLKTAVPLYC
jgi:hypothetical protein